MKKIKSKSFLLLEILIGFLLVGLLLPPLIQTPIALYKSLITNRKKNEIFFEKTIFLHDLMLILQEKKTLKNGEEILLPPHNQFKRRALLHYEYEPEERYSTIQVEIFLTKNGAPLPPLSATLLINPIRP